MRIQSVKDIQRVRVALAHGNGDGRAESLKLEVLNQLVGIAQRFHGGQGSAGEEVLAGRAHAFFSSAPLPAMETLRNPDKLVQNFELQAFRAPIAIAVRKGDADTLNVLDGWDPHGRGGRLASGTPRLLVQIQPVGKPAQVIHELPARHIARPKLAPSDAGGYSPRRRGAGRGSAVSLPRAGTFRPPLGLECAHALSLAAGCGWVPLGHADKRVVHDRPAGPVESGARSCFRLPDRRTLRPRPWLRRPARTAVCQPAAQHSAAGAAFPRLFLCRLLLRRTAAPRRRTGARSAPRPA